VNQLKSRKIPYAADIDDMAIAAHVPTVTSVDVLDMERALLAIAPEQREVVLLVALEDMTYSEVSTSLGIPIGTVMSRLSRGREKLRRLMSGEATRSGLRVVQ
jgi:RNA polymerase sigma-70 factor, ECF subfamily